MITLVPIHIDEDKTKPIYANAYCQELFKSYPDYYYKTGYHPPWIGYFVMWDSNIVGVGGFIGKPENNCVEIAYGTYKPFEGQGIATFTCKQLILLAKSMDPALTIIAKTAPAHNASVKVLRRNGFVFTGLVQDADIGDAWQWVLK